jgi:hypothetical protein
VWHLASGPAPREFARDNFGFNPIALSPDGKLLAIMEDWHGPLQLRDTASGRVVRTLDNARSTLDYLSFSADGQLIISARRNGIRAWRTSGNSTNVWREFPVHGQGVFSVALTPDGRTLISAGKDTSIRLWELATGTLRRSLTGHAGAVHSLTVSPDGRLLASAGEDGKVLLHNLVPLDKARQLSNVGRLWEQLALSDASEASSAAQGLLSSPGDAVDFLTSHLRPVPQLDEEQVQRLICDLDAARFALRTKAARQLETLGSSAALALRQALKGQPSLELRRRIEQLLEAMEELPLSPDELRADRSIEILEQLATPEAARLLEKLAGGAPGARRTEAARLALRRLSR